MVGQHPALSGELGILGHPVEEVLLESGGLRIVSQQNILRQRAERAVGLRPELEDSVGDFEELSRAEKEHQDIAEALWQAADCFDIGYRLGVCPLRCSGNQQAGIH